MSITRLNPDYGKVTSPSITATPQSGVTITLQTYRKMGGITFFYVAAKSDDAVSAGSSKALFSIPVSGSGVRTATEPSGVMNFQANGLLTVRPIVARTAGSIFYVQGVFA